MTRAIAIVLKFKVRYVQQNRLTIQRLNLYELDKYR